MRPLPAPETIPDARLLRPHVRFAIGQQAAFVHICERAWAIVNSCFEQPGPTPAAWPDMAPFIERCRRGDAQNRLYRAVWWQLALKAVERGQLRLETGR